MTTVCLLPVFLFAGLAVQIRNDLHLSVSQVGVGVAAFFLLSAITATPAGGILEQVGARRGLQAASAFSVIALLGLGLSNAYPLLLVFLGIGGLANAVAQVASNVFLARRIHRNRQGFAFGLKQAGAPAAALIGGLAVPGIGLTIGWRWAFIGGASVALAQLPFVPPEEQDSFALGPRGSVDRSRMTILSLIVLASAGALGTMSGNSLGAFFVVSSVTAGIGEATAGLAFAAGSAAGLIVRIWAGWMADRRTSGKLIGVSGLLLIGAIGYLMLASGMALLILPGAVLCFGGGWGWSGLFNLAVVGQNRYMPALATGITNTGLFVGGIAGPLVFSFIVQKTSYGVAWSIVSAWAFTSVLGILLARRMLRKDLAALSKDPVHLSARKGPPCGTFGG